MISGINYNNPSDLQAFIEKLNQDKAELSKIQAKVARLSQHITHEPSFKELLEFKESIALLKGSLETFVGDIQILRQIAKQEEIIVKIEKIVKQDFFTFLDNTKGGISTATSTLDVVSENHPNLDRLSEEAHQTQVQYRQDLATFDSIRQKEELVKKDYTDVEKILKRDPYILFEKPEGRESIFSQLMKTPHAHSLFDHILFIAGEEFYQNQTNPVKKKGIQEILPFAFSRARYEHCYAQDSHITESITLKGSSILKKCTIKELSTKMEKFKSQRHATFNTWQSKRMGTSNSLEGNYSNRDILRRHWVEAETFTLKKAYEHMGTGRPITRELIQFIHKKMASGDIEIPNPGTTRDKLGKQVAAGTSWRNNMCGSPFLAARLDELVSWMNDQFIKCNDGEKNPLIFAAQTYQRVVSLHPFENGNGRIARLMMDYVLARYEIPPIVMGKSEKDVNIAVFPLLPDSTRNPQDFYNNMLNRISESFDELNRELSTLA